MWGSPKKAKISMLCTRQKTMYHLKTGMNYPFKGCSTVWDYTRVPSRIDP